MTTASSDELRWIIDNDDNALFAKKNALFVAKKVIFGIGLNQMSDYWEERMPFENPQLRNMAGSIVCPFSSSVHPVTL